MEEIQKNMKEMEKKKKEMEDEHKREKEDLKRMLEGIWAKDDVWTLEEGMIYRWRDWRLIRTKDSLILWCGANILRLM